MPRQAPARLDGRLQRLRIARQVAARRPCAAASREPAFSYSSAACHSASRASFGSLLAGGQALELGGGLRPLALLQVGHARACCRPRPAAHGSGSAGGSPPASWSRRPSPSAPISAAAASYCALARTADCGATVATRAKCATASRGWPAARALLALLVDRRGLALDQCRCAPASCCRRQRQHLGVGASRRWSKAPRSKARVREHGPGDAALRGRGRRLAASSTCCATVGRLVAVLQRVQLFGGVGQHRAGARVGREGCGEAQRAGDAACAAAPAASAGGGAPSPARRRPATRRSRRRRSSRAPGSRRPPSRTRRAASAKLLVLEQQLGEQEVALRRRRVVREESRYDRGTSAPPPA